MENQVIELPGKGTPNIIMGESEELLMDISQGVRDLGLIPKILGHKGRLIVTNKRAILLEKKTKDYNVSQIKLALTSLVTTAHEFMAKQFIGGLVSIIGGIVLSVIMSNNRMGGASWIPGIIGVIIGLVMIFTCKRQGLSLNSAGGSIFFASMSVPKEQLSKILTIVALNE